MNICMKSKYNNISIIVLKEYLCIYEQVYVT